MKNAWIWILGIVLVLLLVSAPILMHFAFGTGFVRGFDERGPMMDRFGLGRGFAGPMGMHMRGGFGFFGPFALLGGLVKLAFIGVLLYGAYWLGKRNARVTLDPAPVRVVPAAEPPSPSEPGTEDSKQ